MDRAVKKKGKLKFFTDKSDVFKSTYMYKYISYREMFKCIN